MKKMQDKHYIILLIVCVVITVVVVAFTLGKNSATGCALTGFGCIVGLTISALVKNKSNISKTVDEMDSRDRRSLTIFLSLGVGLTMVGIVLLVLYLK